MIDTLLRLAMLFIIGLVLKDFTEKELKLLPMHDAEQTLKDSNAVMRHIKLLESFEIEYPWVVMAQEVHETGWFTSPIYRENHNRFGMKVSSRKFHSGVNRGHAKYDNFIESIRDYRAWQEARLEKNLWVYNDSTYIKMLIRVGYAEDPQYEQKIRETYRKLREMATLPEESK